MHEVATDLQPEVGADRAGRGLGGARRAHQLARGGDGVRALEDGGDDRGGGDVVDQPVEERLADVLGIDPLAAAKRKMVINARKYPVHRARGNARKYNAR